MPWLKNFLSKCFPRYHPQHATMASPINRRFQFPTGGDTEYAEKYRPGGFHPVLLNDVFNNRYRVVSKLGFGSFSTVWLSVDEP